MKVEQIIRERYSDEVEKETGWKVRSCFYMFQRNDGCDVYGLTGNGNRLIAVVVPIDDEEYDLYY